MAEHPLGSVPTPAELLDAPERALALAPTDAAAILAKVDGLASILRLAAAAPEPNGERLVRDDGPLSAAEAAKRTGMSTRWLWKHADTLPFARRIGRAVRFSPAGIEKWLVSRKTVKQTREI